MQKHMKLITLLTISLIIIVLVILSLYYYLHSSILIVQIAPINATASINGKDYSNGIYKLSPKKSVEVIITAKGFKDKKLSLDFQNNHVNKIITYLQPDSNDWEFYEQKGNSESLNILLASCGYDPQDLIQITPNITTDQDFSAQNLIQKLSIKTQTPLNFSICGTPATRKNCNSITINYDYGQDCGNQLCLLISSRTPTLEQSTLNDIRNKLHKSGYNLSKYKYTYTQENL